MDTKKSNASCSRELAELIVGLEFEQIPQEVSDYGRLLLLDLLGAALSGVDTVEAEAARRTTRMISPGGCCTLWGTADTGAVAEAAFFNGILSHARELDDFGGCDHTGAVVFPAILAVAEAFPKVSGKRLLEAVVAGYEVGRRVLDSLGGYRPHNHTDGFHSTGTCGSFAAAAAVAKLLELSVDQTVWAIGLAGSFTGGTWAFSEDGAMSKRYHVGRAAEAGVRAALLAKNGFTGPEYIFEAEWGDFLRLYSKNGGSENPLKAPLGNVFGIMRSGIKPYAACRDIHSSLDVVLQARLEHGLAVEDIEQIEVSCIPEMVQMIGTEKLPATRFEAQLNLRYSIAVAFVTGRAFIAEFDQPFLFDENVLTMAKKVKIVENPELPFDSEPHIIIKTTAGEIITGHVPFASGAPQNPLAEERVIEKFRSLATQALPLSQVNQILEMNSSISELSDVSLLVHLLKSV